MTFTLRPAARENTPLIVGIAGATKSGKTKSAHRLAQGLAAATGGGPVVMLNSEGPRGHQYADQYPYIACDIQKPYAYKRYTEAMRVIRASKPGVIVIDSLSHAHDGPGGMLEAHEANLNRMAGEKTGKARDAYTWAAWVEPKADENEFVYELLDVGVPVVLCFRAKEKIKLDRVKAENGMMKTEIRDLGWQPILSDRVAFETLFTLMLTPHCKGVPDLSLSDMREPFDTLVPPGEPLSEALGSVLAEWAKGKTGPRISPEQVAHLTKLLTEKNLPVARLLAAAKVSAMKEIPDYQRALDWITKA